MDFAELTRATEPKPQIKLYKSRSWLIEVVSFGMNSSSVVFIGFVLVWRGLCLCRLYTSDLMQIEMYAMQRCGKCKGVFPWQPWCVYCRCDSACFTMWAWPSYAQVSVNANTLALGRTHQTHMASHMQQHMGSDNTMTFIIQRIIRPPNRASRKNGLFPFCCSKLSLFFSHLIVFSFLSLTLWPKCFVLLPLLDTHSIPSFFHYLILS